MHVERYMHCDVQPGNVTLAGPDVQGEFPACRVYIDREMKKIHREIYIYTYIERVGEK